jgi:uncharacterized protein YbjT (DUF2867 family)
VAKKALLLGATGLVGGYCLYQLLSCDDYDQVTVLTRSPLDMSIVNEGADELSEDAVQKLHVINGDMATLEASLKDVDADHIYCCLGTTIKKAGSQDAFKRVDYEYPLAVAKLYQNKASAFVLVSSIGARSSSKVFYSRVKGEIEEELIALNFPQLNIMQPSLITGPRQERRLGEVVAIGMMSPFSEFMIGFLGQYRPRHAREIAIAMVTSVTRVKGPKVWRIRSAQIGEMMFVAEHGKAPEPEL